MTDRDKHDEPDEEQPAEDSRDDSLWKELEREPEAKPGDDPDWLDRSQDYTKSISDAPVDIVSPKLELKRPRPLIKEEPPVKLKPPLRLKDLAAPQSKVKRTYRKVVSTLVLLLVLAGFAGIVAYFTAPEPTYRFLALVKDNVLKYRGDSGGEMLISSEGKWLPAGPGMHLREIMLKRKKNISGVKLVCLRLAPSEFEFNVLPVDKAQRTNYGSTLLRKLRVDVVINGGFYNERGAALGLLLVDNHEISPLFVRGELGGVIGIADHTLDLVDRESFRSRNYKDGIQSGPWLVRGGQAMTEFKNPWQVERRAAVCLDSHKRVIFVATDAAVNGLSFGELSRLLAMPEDLGGLGCVDALNLDGGSSAMLAFSGDKHAASVRAFSKVPVVIAASHNPR